MALFRTPLARSMYMRATNDFTSTQCPPILPAKYYACDVQSLEANLQNAWVPLDCDESCRDFLRYSYVTAASFCLQLLYSVVLACLKPFLARTTINGLLGRGSMHVLSTQQFQQLRNHGSVSASGRLGSLLDIGAGDGRVTKQLQPLFSEVFATEMSSTMRWRLKRAGFTVLPTDEWGGRRFDVISCLNVLDRCQKPLALLEKIRQSLKPGGLLLVGMVLPLHQTVENGPNMMSAKESLPYCGSYKWEENVHCVVSQLFEPSGFRLRALSRVPYLSEGDLTVPYYSLDEALLLLEPTA